MQAPVGDNGIDLWCQGRGVFVNQDGPRDAPEPFSALFASKHTSQEGPLRRGTIFDNNRVVRAEQPIFMA